MDVWVSVISAILLMTWQSSMSAATVRQSMWRKVFSVDVIIPGHSSKFLSLSSKFQCFGLCTREPSCLSFAFQPGSGTCWLYNDLVQYDLIGSVAADTHYYWRQGLACPLHLGYDIDAGLCFKVSSSKTGWFQAQAVCRGHGGDLFVGSSQKRIDTLRRHTKKVGKAWLGASEESGEWRWVDGSKLPLSFPAWGTGQPSGGVQRWVALKTSGRLDDVRARISLHYVCEIPL